MKTCKGCKQKFRPAKHYYYICPQCIDMAAKCGKCKRTVFPIDNKYTCCGITETLDHVKYVEEHNKRVQSRFIRTMELAGIFSPIEDYDLTDPSVMNED